MDCSHRSAGLLSVVVAVLINSPACPVLFAPGVECGGDGRTACGSVCWVVRFVRVRQGSSGLVRAHQGPYLEALEGSSKSRRVRMTCKEQNLPYLVLCTSYVLLQITWMPAREGDPSVKPPPWNLNLLDMVGTSWR